MEEQETKNKSGSDEISPDELMESFKGRGLKTIILFTVVIHAVLLLGTSIPFLKKAVTGKDTSELSERERMELAMKEATDSLRDIAEEHGLNVQDISSNFSDKKSFGGAQAPEVKTPKIPEETRQGETSDPKSDIEKDLKIKKDGPQIPKVNEEEDLFK